MPKLWAVLAGVLVGMGGCGGEREPSGPATAEPVRLSGNWHSSCAIDDGGALWCWGAFGGPSGDARSAPSGTPVRIGTDIWREVAVATSHACAIRDDGSLWCWGHNCAGQVGDGTREDRALPTRVGVSTAWRTVAVGGGHSCAIDEAGGLYCWGGADYGQQICESSPPLPPTRLDGVWIAVSSHYYSTHALRSDGTLWRWQDFSFGNLTSPYGYAEALGDTHWRSIATGVGFVCGVRSDGRLACVEDEHASETMIGTDHDWSNAIAAGYHTCATKRDGSLWCWGPNSQGQIGTGSLSVLVGEPTQVGQEHDWLEVSAGGSSTCGRRAGAGVLCWGGNESGELGIDDFPYRPAPSQVGHETGWSAPTIGYRFSCALQNGGLRCWGSDAQGQLGIEPPSDQMVPAVVPGNWTHVAAASFSTCAIDDASELWCWGGAGLGGSVERREIGSASWAAVAAGEGGTCVLTTSGTASCWPGSYKLNVAPDPLAGFTWRSIASSYSHTCGIGQDGALRCWGKNSHGELGIGVAGNRATPTEVAGGGKWLMVSTGNGGLAGAGGYSCAISDDGAASGRLYCWGGGGYDRLGTGSDVDALVPVQIGSDGDWTSVSAGPIRACAIKQNGQLWCWGRNDDGGLGIGIADGDPHLPTRIGPEQSWAQVAVRFHTCATATDGTLWCWGWGGGGELGEGSAWRVEPTPVVFETIP